MKSPSWVAACSQTGVEYTSTLDLELAATDFDLDSQACLPVSSPVAVCDPRPGRAAELAAELAAVGLDATAVDDLGALERHCLGHAPTVIILPLSWPGDPACDPSCAASAVLEFIRSHAGQAAVVVYADTTRLPIGVYCRALVAGARQVLNLQAPTFVEDLCRTAARLVRDHQAHVAEEGRLAALFEGFGLVGNSSALREVFRRVLKAAHFSDLPVLLLGETGTGKQRLAEAIHALDPKRRDKPFLTVNCSAISKTLAESELFGHVKGAFSGAGSDRLGLFRSANGGTLLLDEVGELDPELQPKLLRVLQDRQLLPVGEDFEHAVDVRILAATNRPLKEMVAAGRFREDLYQRLNVFQIRVPPLRERPDDIEAQARCFLRQCGAGRATPVTDFGPRVLEALRLLPWEGNSRQLRNFLWEALSHKGDGWLLEMEDLPRWVLEALAQAPQQMTELTDLEVFMEDASRRGLPLSQAVEEYERCLLAAALKENGGNRTRTAQQLGLTPRSIFNKIKKYHLG